MTDTPSPGIQVSRREGPPLLQRNRPANFSSDLPGNPERATVSRPLSAVCRSCCCWRPAADLPCTVCGDTRPAQRARYQKRSLWGVAISCGLWASRVLPRAFIGSPAAWHTSVMSEAQLDVYFDTCLLDAAIPYMSTGDLLLCGDRNMHHETLAPSHITHVAMILRRPGPRWPAQDDRFCRLAAVYGVPQAHLDPSSPFAEDLFTLEVCRRHDAVLLPLRTLLYNGSATYVQWRG
eukprot:TRINITY_DN47576_c0_g1_i1.p1 TRINITY_DN47576_c0_g1~~TRINITY_DN47576_c0_g1_i1.p1  ORF type:complete len:235 (-),score=0.72 TRINITY_DN47576_c0_g1_i1:37-741(-)